MHCTPIRHSASYNPCIVYYQCSIWPMARLRHKTCTNSHRKLYVVHRLLCSLVLVTNSDGGYVTGNDNDNNNNDSYYYSITLVAVHQNILLTQTKILHHIITTIKNTAIYSYFCYHQAQKCTRSIPQAAEDGKKWGYVATAEREVIMGIFGAKPTVGSRS